MNHLMFVNIYLGYIDVSYVIFKFIHALWWVYSFKMSDGEKAIITKDIDVDKRVSRIKINGRK